MILTLDVGNSHIFGGVIQNKKMLTQFRKSSTTGFTSDEFGVFLRGVLRENEVPIDRIKQIAICTVMPALSHTLTSTCLKYFKIQPFMLHPNVKTGLKILYNNPLELGADRIANAIAGIHLYPDRNIVIVGFGTATTICAISRKKEYLGGLIMPGIRISMQALSSATARLPTVEIKKPERIIGKSTVENIQSGLYYGNLAVVREMVKSIKTEYFNHEDTIVIGTGGFVRLFENENVFDRVIHDLVLTGLCRAVEMNTATSD